MSSIQSLIEMLQSEDHKKRYEACEQLKAFPPPLPQEAIAALKVAENDANVDVANAARKALYHSFGNEKLHNQNKETVANSRLIGFVGWILISSWFNWSVVLEMFHWRDRIFYIVLIANQLVGLGLAFLAFRFNMRRVGAGILWGIGLFFLGSIINSICRVPPLVLPFPLGAIVGGC